MQHMDDEKISNVEEMRAELAGKSGRRYWRSLEELTDSPKFRTWLEDEFPTRASILMMNRRDLLKFMGASMALAGLAGCRSVFLPQDKIVPYVKQPEELVPGKPLFYATTLSLGGYGTGVLVEQHEGRPIKIEGNPEHSASNGALDAISQSELLSLYDPERLGDVLQDGDISTWELFTQASRGFLTTGSIAILTGAITSPSLVAQIQRFVKAHPGTTWYSYEPVGRQNVFAGTTQAFGRPLEPIYDFKQAKVIVSLDSDFLSPTANPGSLTYAKDFADARRVEGTTGQMNRVYAFESDLTLVGAIADHRWSVKSSAIAGIAAALASALGVTNAGAGQPPAETAAFDALIRDLKAQNGVVVTGDHQPAEVHALVALINAALQTKAVRYIPSPNAAAGQPGIKALSEALVNGQVKTLITVGANPIYDAPSDFKFANAYAKAANRVYFSTSDNETAKASNWVLPATHELEQWGDVRAFDGSVSLQQPLIAPLYQGRSALEFFAALNGDARSGYDLLREFWKASGRLGKDTEAGWRDFVHDGVLPNSRSMAVIPKASAQPISISPAVPGLEVNFRPDAAIYDGRFANNGWLQELPRPITKMTWDNVAQMSPATAKALGVKHEDIVTLTRNGVSVEAGVFTQPGQAADTILLNLGYGRTAGGSVATVTGEDGGGFNAYLLRDSQSLAFGPGLTVKLKEDGAAQLASTQSHSPLNNERLDDDRDIIRETTLAAFLENNQAHVPEHAPSKEFIEKNNLYVEEVFAWDGPQWGMTIDMNVGVGCNACVAACTAENNISVVGKIQVNRNREMHWIRIDRYYSGAEEEPNPQITWQPVACVHCEKAPCEPVCPVAATVHSHEGLNQMIYNRCVGTRYCSNNCPYKVRRFNYLNYSDNQPNFSETVWQNHVVTGTIHQPKNNGISLLKLMNNPDVTVRGRGIMEKCTYCVQRINEARVEAKKQAREVREGEIITSCQQACPTKAIVFGNIADKNSQVAKLRKDPRSYLLLEELQTRPRTSHLAKLRNPNPEIATKTEAKAG